MNSGKRHLLSTVYWILNIQGMIMKFSHYWRKQAQTHVENRRQTYLEAIRNTMQKPVGGLSAQVLRNQAKVEPIYRGGIDNLHALVQHSVMSALALS